MDTITVSVVIFFLSTPNNVENIQKRTLYLKKKKKERKKEREGRRKEGKTHTHTSPHIVLTGLGANVTKPASIYLP